MPPSHTKKNNFKQKSNRRAVVVEPSSASYLIGILGVMCSRSRVRIQPSPIFCIKKIAGSLDKNYNLDFWCGRSHRRPNHWNGQRMSLQQGVSHTPVEWTDGNAWAGSFPYFGRKKLSMVPPPPVEYCPTLQNGQMDVPPAGTLEWTDGNAWACSFPYFRRWSFYASQSGTEEGGLGPKNP